MSKDVEVEGVPASMSMNANPAPVSIWQPFSHIHIYSAYNLALKATEIEGSYKNAQEPAQPAQELIDEHFAYVIGSIFASVAFLDAMVNEVFWLTDKYAQGKDLDTSIKPLPTNVKESMAQIWAAIVKKDGKDVIEVDPKNQKKEIKPQKQVYSRPVYGFDRSIQGGLIENRTEKRVIERMRDLKRQGVSYLRIAEHLNEQGIPTKRGGRWWDSTVRGILLNGQ